MLNKIIIKQKNKTKFGDYTVEFKTFSDVKVKNYNELWDWLVKADENTEDEFEVLSVCQEPKLIKKNIIGFIEEDMHNKETERSKQYHS